MEPVISDLCWPRGSRESDGLDELALEGTMVALLAVVTYVGALVCVV